MPAPVVTSADYPHFPPWPDGSVSTYDASYSFGVT
jgi:hypothetical protein